MFGVICGSLSWRLMCRRGEVDWTLRPPRKGMDGQGGGGFPWLSGHQWPWGGSDGRQAWRSLGSITRAYVFRFLESETPQWDPTVRVRLSPSEMWCLIPVSLGSCPIESISKRLPVALPCAGGPCDVHWGNRSGVLGPKNSPSNWGGSHIRT